jgi:hypothetical protein
MYLDTGKGMKGDIFPLLALWRRATIINTMRRGYLFQIEFFSPHLYGSVCLAVFKRLQYTAVDAKLSCLDAVQVVKSSILAKNQSSESINQSSRSPTRS